MSDYEDLTKDKEAKKRFEEDVLGYKLDITSLRLKAKDMKASTLVTKLRLVMQRQRKLLLAETADARLEPVTPLRYAAGAA